MRTESKLSNLIDAAYEQMERHLKASGVKTVSHGCAECRFYQGRLEALNKVREAMRAERRAPVDARTARLRRAMDRIAEIIEAVDNRAMAADGPVTPTLEEMTQAEMTEIYKLAKGKRKK